MARTNENRPRPTVWLWPLLAAAMFFRFYELGIKPPHFDEGINGHFVLTIWRDGFYSYDPTNFHGPLYFYLLQIAEVLFGRGVESFRIINGFLGTALVYAVFRMRHLVGSAAVVAGWILAVSPAFTFYSRYAIHETLFVIGQILFVTGRLQWISAPSRRAAAVLAAGLVIMVASKETFFIFVGTWIIAEAIIRVLEKLEKSDRPWNRFSELSAAEGLKLKRDVVVVIGVSLFVLTALFTGFFENMKGIGDFFKAFDVWSKTGSNGNGHEKEFLYWIKQMARYEWAILIGFLVSIPSWLFLRSESRAVRLILLTGFGTWLAYSIIPYKTPWLILSFWPLTFFCLSHFERGKTRFVTALVLGAVLVHGVVESRRLNFVDYANSAEPYVYVQTTKDYTSVMDVLRKQIAKHPESRNSSIVIMVQDPWPLPYEMSQYPKMRYARLEDIDSNMDILRNADLILIDDSAIEGLRRVFPKRFGRMSFHLRDAYGAGWALFDFEKFQSVLPAQVVVEEIGPGAVVK